MNTDVKDHIINSISQGIRLDGRKGDMREITVEYGVTRNAEGSARVKFGDCEVLAGVKLGLEKPYPDTPDQGNLMVNAELIPLSNPDFESGPPGIDSIELARVVDRGIRESKAIDLKKLCIEEGEKAWTVMIDIITMNAEGNLFDIAGLAALAALKDTKLRVIENGMVDYKTFTDEKLPLVKEPILVTVFKIGNNLVVDPTEIEEKAADSRLSVSTIEDGTIVAVQKGGEGVLTAEEIDKMVEIATKTAKEIRKKL